LLQIEVRCEEPLRLVGSKRDITMIPFTGEASGPYFKGHIIGPGVDTQKIGKNGTMCLSARYMLEGQDFGGTSCRIFIENQGVWGKGFVPTVVTDSPLLADWETADLYAEVSGIPGGVLVKVFRRGE
jgi:hypothetical protein